MKHVHSKPQCCTERCYDIIALSSLRCLATKVDLGLSMRCMAAARLSMHTWFAIAAVPGYA